MRGSLSAFSAMPADKHPLTSFNCVSFSSSDRVALYRPPALFEASRKASSVPYTEGEEQEYRDEEIMNKSYWLAGAGE